MIAASILNKYPHLHTASRRKSGFATSSRHMVQRKAGMMSERREYAHTTRVPYCCCAIGPAAWAPAKMKKSTWPRYLNSIVCCSSAPDSRYAVLIMPTTSAPDSNTASVRTQKRVAMRAPIACASTVCLPLLLVFRGRFPPRRVYTQCGRPPLIVW